MELCYYMRKEIDRLTEENQQLREDKQQLSDALNTTRIALEKLELFSKSPSPPEQPLNSAEEPKTEKSEPES